MRRDLAHVLQILPVDTAPGDALVRLFDGDFAELGFDLRECEAPFVKTSSRLGPIFDFCPALCGMILDWAGFRSHVDAIELHFNKSIARKQIPAAQKQPINSIGGGFGGFPVLGLLSSDALVEV